jgi:hypothetical protein
MLFSAESRNRDKTRILLHDAIDGVMRMCANKTQVHGQHIVKLVLMNVNFIQESSFLCSNVPTYRWYTAFRVYYLKKC